MQAAAGRGTCRRDAAACCCVVFNPPLGPTNLPACSNQLPNHPLRSLLGTAAASLVLALAIQLLAVRFAIDTWGEALEMAAALLLIDTCLNAR